MNRGRSQVNRIRFMLAILVVAAVLWGSPTARAADVSGNCGEGVSWSVSAGVLTVSGGGAMADYTEIADAPWYLYREQIHRVVIADGVDSVGDFAFFGMTGLVTVQMADSVQKVGNYAFYECTALETVQLGNGVQSLGSGAFAYCRALKLIDLPGSLLSIGREAFFRCESLLSVVIPASVTHMEQKVFTYCSGLCTAQIRATISTLPHWTFYGCYSLKSVSLASGITTIGTDAFGNCDALKDADYGGVGQTADSLQQQIQQAVPELDTFTPGQSLVNQPEKEFVSSQVPDSPQAEPDRIVFDGPNSTVDTQIAYTDGGNTTVEIDAILNNADGWEDLIEQIQDNRPNTAAQVQVDVVMDAPGVLYGKDLAQLAGQEMTLVLRTRQGAVWHINCKDLSESTLQESYSLSYTLTPLEQLTQGQASAIGVGQGYLLEFQTDFDFFTALELPLGRAYQEASFYLEEKKDTYALLQRVVIDSTGKAHFYIGSVQGGTPYLIGVSDSAPGDENSENAIIPDSMENEHLPVEWIDKSQYIVTDVKSSWGITIGQLTWILVGVILASVIVVGVVMGVLNRRKIKNKPFAQQIK